MALDEGGQYGLISHKDFGLGSKKCVYVKLTDSSLKAIEDYLSSRNASRIKVSIHLSDQNGVLKIPETHGGGFKAYTLSLSELPGDPNGSHDFVRKKDENDLEVIDTMVHKLTVHATEDVYQSTKTKMAIVDEESKKNCAKEIKAGGKGVGKKVKVLRPNGGNIPHPQHVSAFAGAGRNSRLSTSPMSRVSPPSANVGSMAADRAGSTVRSLTDSLAHCRKSTAPLSMSTASAVSHRPKNAELLTVPLRQRIVHLLAQKPYTKPELLVKLKADGISQADAGLIDSVAAEVAAVNKRMQFILIPECIKEVDPNWKFYTEKQVVRSHVQANEASLKVGNNRVVPAIASSAPTPFMENSLKRPPPSHELHGTTSKRICHNSTASTADRTASKHEIKGPSMKSGSRAPAADDYMSRYTVLTSADQRRQYKEDFNTEYEEYLALHKALEQVSKRFAELADKLSKAENDSTEHATIEKEIRKEYRLVKADAKYVDQKWRLEYLHRKLAHIKSLIVDYDGRTSVATASSGSSSAAMPATAAGRA